MTTLNESLTLLAAQIKCDPAELIGYTNEDDLGGYHIDESQRKWPQGSAWAVELQTLYALVRHFKPEVIVEIGGWLGASASHMALACRANGKGHITSVDNGVGGQPHGALIPSELREYVTLVNEDGRVWLAAATAQSIGLLFEDADHSTQLVMELTRLALTKIEPAGILATHDAGHDFAIVGGGQKIGSSVGREVREGLARAGAYSTVYLAEPSDCGLAITVIPGVKKPKEPIATKDNPIVAVNGVNVHSTKLANDHLAALSQVGNANIESMSEPPAVKTPEDYLPEGWIISSEDDTKEPPVKKMRKRKPKAQ